MIFMQDKYIYALWKLDLYKKTHDSLKSLAISLLEKKNEKFFSISLAAISYQGLIEDQIIKVQIIKANIRNYGVPK